MTLVNGESADNHTVSAFPLHEPSASRSDPDIGEEQDSEPVADHVRPSTSNISSWIKPLLATMAGS